MAEPGDEAPADGAVDADAAVVQGEAAPSSRVRLSADAVVGAALAIIDDEGLARVTMRRVGERLGVEAMALYRYVHGREDLLDLVVEAIVAQMYEDDDVLAAPRDGWQDFLQRLAHGVRRVALAHPQAFPLVASRPAEAPWLRPPLRSLDWVESFLDGLRTEGFSDDAAVAAYRSFTSFLLGHLLLEVSMRGADLGPLDVLKPDTEPPGGRLQEFPTVARLRSQLSEDRSAEEFEEGLEELLGRINLTVASR